MRRRLFLAGAAAVLAAARGGRAQGTPASVTSLTLFAGTREGLWRTLDWGRSWDRVRGATSGVKLDPLGAARAVVPMGPQVWVAGDGGLFLSHDFGATWEPLSLTPNIESVLISRWPQADPTVFVGTAEGLLRSRDGGRTFSPTALATGPVLRLEWPGPALVVAGGPGLLVTMDEGQTFQGPGQGLPEGGVKAMALSSYFGVDPVLFAASAEGGVFRSGDGGATWAPAGLAHEIVGDLVWLGPFLYAAGEEGFHRSDDAGKTWTRLAQSPGRPSRLMFPLAPAAGLEAFLATDGGVFHTSDTGQTWEVSGFEGQEVLTVATFPPPRTDLEVGR
jgi:photosystem II stability/assembly factor-like uncharacterized protein